MTRKHKVEIIPYEPPPNSIIISDEQFRRMEDAIKEAKKPNPIPWLVIGLVLIFLIFGGMALGIVAIMKPTPIVYQITPNTVAVKTDTPIPTVTKTPTSTSTPDLTRTMESSPAWQVIRDYISYAMKADFGSAWSCLTTRCKNTMCWDRWNGDYLKFQEWWREWGKMEIRKINPEILTSFDAQAFVTLYFYRDELTHDYRFYLKKVDGSWKIDRIEYVAPMK